MAANKHSHSVNKKATPFCQAWCPLHVDARGYLRLISLGEFEEALKVVLEHNPLPSVCGSICTHPCEIECRRSQADEPLAVRELKGFVSDGVSDVSPPKPAKDSGKKIAVVGSGPSGLSCAYFSAIRGHSVTVFESKEHVGGMMYYGIPSFRLDRLALSRDIDYIRKLGISFRTNTEVGDGKTLKVLLDKFDALYLACGTHKSAKLGVPGESLSGVYHGLGFLADFNAGKKTRLGDRVIVIGGGDASIDAARCAIKAGSRKVKVLYRRSKEEMPACSDEVEACMKDGAAFEYLSIPKRFTEKNGKVAGVECVKAKLGKPDSSGRRRPVPVEGSDFLLDADSVIVAISQKPELESFKKEGLKDSSGLIEVDKATLATNIPSVFAGGDAVCGPSSVVEAMAYGLRASESIHAHLSGEKYRGRELSSELTELSDSTLSKIKRIKRSEGNLSESFAVYEALRCLGCGHGAVVDSDKCASCLACVRICPYGVPKIREDKAVIDMNECQSCGFCMAECPANAISMNDGFDEYFMKKKSSIPSKGKPLLLLCSRANQILKESEVEFPSEKIVVDCLGRISKPEVLGFLGCKVSSLSLISCDDGTCTHRTGITYAAARVGGLSRIVTEIYGFNPIKVFQVSQILAEGFNNLLEEIIEEK